ncbi:MAG: glycosyltransferase family 4 protein [Anaerolineae bacterium]|nr:glycosyltransferase family 4 protein [Anaerolineae bacterium]
MKVAVVVPRYGADVIGGAETLARGFARAAARRGWAVEVWTTCARSHYTWKNTYKPGREESEGVVIHRFAVAQQDVNRQADLNRRLERQGRLDADDQYTWLESGAHSPSLYDHVARHAAEFDALIALPCASPLAHYAAWTASDRAIVWPCLHDEPYAYMEPNRILMESCRGVMFLSPEERDLAVQHLGIRPRRSGTIGGGVSPDRQCSRAAQAPQDLLYVGRLEPGKGLALLYDYVLRYADQGGDVRLVILGQGPLKPPRHRAFEYRGFVPEAQKARAYKAALALCQPSLNESFSLTIMESWLAARPVLVHGQCAVTRGHVRRSRGGLWFQTYEEFAGAVEWLRANPTQAGRMGENGREYVARNYSWEAVLSRFERTIGCWEKDA